MSKIAIIQFPGTNCEAESFRAIKDVGMEPELFRWNRDKEDLRKFDGYFIPGGFSYEDRVRSGAIAGRDPLMKVIKQESAKGKPVIGICNGAQILVESGMIPGLEASHLGASLSWNEKGYLNIWVRIKNDSDKVDFLIEQLDKKMNNHNFNDLNISYRQLHDFYKNCNHLTSNERIIYSEKINDIFDRIRNIIVIEEIA